MKINKIFTAILLLISISVYSLDIDLEINEINENLPIKINDFISIEEFKKIDNKIIIKYKRFDIDYKFNKSELNELSELHRPIMVDNLCKIVDKFSKKNPKDEGILNNIILSIEMYSKNNEILLKLEISPEECNGNKEINIIHEKIKSIDYFLEIVNKNLPVVNGNIVTDSIKRTGLNIITKYIIIDSEDYFFNFDEKSFNKSICNDISYARNLELGFKFLDLYYDEDQNIIKSFTINKNTCINLLE